MLPRRLLLAGLAGGALLPALPRAAAAHSYTAGDIAIGHPWSRAAPARGTGAGFLTLRNTGATADRLVGGRADVARAVEVHSHVRDGDVMRMRPVEGGLEIAPGAEVTLAPGGFHLMLIGLKEPLVQGQRVAVTLVFARAGEVTVELAVESAGYQPRGAAGAPAGGHNH